MVGIYLEAISDNREYFVRAKSSKFDLVNMGGSNQLAYSEKNICVRRGTSDAYKMQSSLAKAVKAGHESAVNLLLEKGAISDQQALVAAVEVGVRR